LPKKTFETAAEAQAHLIVQLKDNQPTLCRKVEAVCNDTKPLSCVQTVDSKKRNRHETRTVAVFNARPAVAGTEWQPHVAAIIAVERNVLTFRPATGLWDASRETALYLSNRPIRARKAAGAVRPAIIAVAAPGLRGQSYAGQPMDTAEIRCQNLVQSTKTGDSSWVDFSQCPSGLRPPALAPLPTIGAGADHKIIKCHQDWVL
jgi:hypothetical protein